MHSTNFTVVPVALPTQSQIRGFYPSVNLADAYAIALPDRASRDPEVLARVLFSRRPLAMHVLLKVRDLLVGPFGIKTADHLETLGASEPRIGIFKIYDSTANEIVLGEDDKHLDFRLSVLCRPAIDAKPSASEVVVSTVVMCHNWIGRAYIVLVAPFHRVIVRASMRRAARSGWPMRSAE